MDHEKSKNQNPANTLKSATLFVILALGFAFLYWLLVALANAGHLGFSMTDSLAGHILKGVLRDFGPALAAVLTEGLIEGRVGLFRLWSSLVRWKIPSWLYLLAIILPFIADGLVVAVGIATDTLKLGTGSFSPFHFLIVFIAMAIVDGPLGEEIGWRGKLLPDLLKRMRPLSASIWVGCIWCLWHVPLYIADRRSMNWANYLAGTVAYSIIFTWFYLCSGGSTLLSIFLHNTTNFAIYLLLLNIWMPIANVHSTNVPYDVVWFLMAGIAATALWRMSPTVSRDQKGFSAAKSHEV